MKWIEYTVKVLTNVVWGSVAIKFMYDIAHRKHLIYGTRHFYHNHISYDLV